MDEAVGGRKRGAFRQLDAEAELALGDGRDEVESEAEPVRVRFDTLPDYRKPLSGTASFSSAWQSDDNGQDFAAAVIERWRRQRR